MASGCLFCKLVEGSIPSTKIYEDENVIGFKDLRPQAAEHYLFIHKKHTNDISDMMKNDPAQIQDIFQAITTFTSDKSISKNGFRVVTNQGGNAGQTVFHTHLHLLGGEPLGHFGS